MTSPAARRKRVLTYARSDLRMQFGQAHDQLTYNGKTACGHTCVQFLVGLWKGKEVTLDEVAHAVHYPDARQAFFGIGLYERQVIEALRAWDIHYEVRDDLTTDELIGVVHDRGPAIIEVQYRWWPDWHGKVYAGVRSDGKPNGFARPLGHAGKTQTVGFDGPEDYHYGLVLSHYKTGTQREREYVRDPNHGSPVRPEKPPYDVISRHQLDQLHRSLKSSPRGRLWAAVPKGALGG